MRIEFGFKNLVYLRERQASSLKPQTSSWGQILLIALQASPSADG